MLNLLKALKNNDGVTMKHGKVITYKTGYQVADRGVECATAEEAAEAVKTFGGSCGVWLSDGIYYVDHSFRVNTKREALRIGKEYNQISIFGWQKKNLIFC